MKKTIRRAHLAAFLFTAVMGTLLHFAYDAFPDFPLTAVVSSVNESVWEHMKLFYFPMLAAALVQRLFPFMQRQDFWCIKLLGIITGLFLIPALYYTYTGALGIHLTWIDISIFYVAAGAAYLLETHLLMQEPRRACRFARIAMLFTVSLAFVFLFFTYFPPHLPIFRDPVTLTCGIPK
ncbi:MAG: hypothetical protein IKL99_05035 [Oscillospiraceae bacterium]|nr:hypothetical protein [Oscillospiraceae bacterium]